MAKYRITRLKPSASRAGDATQQTRIVEIAAGRPVPAGAESVASETELTAWTDTEE